MTIGIIFCTDKDETMVKYSVLQESQQIFVLKYMIVLPTVEELELVVAYNKTLAGQFYGEFKEFFQKIRWSILPAIKH